MSSSKITQHFRKTVFPIHFVNHRVRCLQLPSLMLRNLRPDLFQSSLSRPYANSSPSPHTSPEESTSSSYLNKFTKYIAKRLPTAILTNIIVTGLVGLISVDLLYAWYRNGCNERLLNETVEKGTRPEIDVLNDELVSRPLVVDRLKKIFQPHRNQSFYHMVCGEHGTGKTTLTRIASREVGQGVIYVDTPADIEDFGKAFGRALNFAFEEHISWSGQLTRKVLGDTNNKFEDPKWKRAMEAFKRASAMYKKKHNKPSVIVYDNVSRLVHKNPEILDILQDDAKDNADDRKYIAVFVSSEESIPRRMESRSAWSRAKKPAIEIGDLNEEESMEYLTKKLKINEVEAKKLYELVGGRIVELKTATTDFLAGQSFKGSFDIKQQILTEVENKFRTAKLLENYKYHEVGKRIVSALLNSKELSRITFEKFFNKPEEANEVLETNVFAYHPENNTVTFQSRSVECYIRENASIFIK
ncbi:9424_t:CDS:2 [Ambispora leptoticha]|uniref:9424_t:CDS:1 n=1 Tax=Ambispora leptoticha TaxID=144679 RepID=A0A9N9BKK2_9GLOM|nr:9424_t:CDS:2 [Ambispora leptoticha]